MASAQGSSRIRHSEGVSRMLETPSERTASEAVLESVSPEVEVVTLSPSMQLRMRAAQLLREKGWCQGSFRKMDGRMCLIGAIGFASNPTWIEGSGLPLDAIGLVYQEIIPQLEMDPVNWND